jgi:glyoxylase-like metal-dependent hydrolase (beta-lactamase superfamily II)
MIPTVQAFYHKPTYTFTYVVRDPNSSAAVIVDPVLDYDHKSGRTGTASADAVAAFVADNGLSVEWILETHAHADHLTAAPYLKERLNARVGIGEGIRTVQAQFKKVFNMKDLATDGSQFNRLFVDGETITVGALSVKVMSTPGHTRDSVTYVVGDAAFIGDTMFSPDYGTARVDFPGGDARQLYQSIRKLLSLPPETRLFLCHDYPPEGRSETPSFTVAQQRRENVHIHDGVCEDEFVAMRESRDATLSMPALIIPSVQLNIRAGQFPVAEDNGVSYLKVPLNMLGRPL